MRRSCSWFNPWFSVYEWFSICCPLDFSFLFNNKIMELFDSRPEDLYIYLSIGEAGWTRIYYFSVIESLHIVDKKGWRNHFPQRSKTKHTLGDVSPVDARVICIVFTYDTRSLIRTHMSVSSVCLCARVCIRWNLNPSKTVLNSLQRNFWAFEIYSGFI